MRISYIAMSKIVEEAHINGKYPFNKNNKDLKPFEELPVISNARKLDEQELIKNLQEYSINVDREEFNSFCTKFLSAEDMTKEVVKKYNKTIKVENDKKVDLIWTYITVLWERWFPDIPNFEMLDDLIQNGYKKLNEGEKSIALDLWSDAWRAVLFLVKKG